MNILFDLGHPAHVHLFKHFIRWLGAQGHNVVVVSREKDLTGKLLDKEGIAHLPVSKASKGKLGNILELIKRDLALFGLHRKHHFDIAFGTSVSIGHLSKISRVRSFNFNEDDDSAVPLYALLAYPFCDRIVNPDCLKFKRWQEKRLLHKSFHELAYLHPNRFDANRKLLDQYGLEPHQYVIVRKSSLAAHHDTHASGLDEHLWTKIQQRVTPLKIIASIEGNKSHDIAPEHMHHIMAFARLVISDSQTMTAESAVLGVPSIRVSSFVGKLSYLEELEHRYGLTFGFLPDEEERIFHTLDDLLETRDLPAAFQEKRKKMLAEKEDLNEIMQRIVAQKQVRTR